MVDASLLLTSIENNLSYLLDKMDYDKYVGFINDNELLTLYDFFIDKSLNMPFDDSQLNLINEIIKSKVNEIKVNI